MSPNNRNVARLLLGLLCLCSSLWIHYEVKIVGSGGDHGDGLGELQIGTESPDRSATDLQGQPIVLSRFRNHKVVVVDFWASWCSPCVMAMPALQELHDEFNERNVEVNACSSSMEGSSVSSPPTVRGGPPSCQSAWACRRPAHR